MNRQPGYVILGNGPSIFVEPPDTRELATLVLRGFSGSRANGKPEPVPYTYRGAEASPAGICEYCQRPFDDCVPLLCDPTGAAERASWRACVDSYRQDWRAARQARHERDMAELIGLLAELTGVTR